MPIGYSRLENGLRVVLSPDHTAPTATIALYYKIGCRIEPRGRTGFAHLFEHLMFPIPSTRSLIRSRAARTRLRNASCCAAARFMWQA